MPPEGTPRLARIHLDALGGLAGDMFAAAMADAFPALVPGLLRELAKLPAPEGARIAFARHADGALAGRRFVVEAPGHSHGHAHVAHRDIRAKLQAAGLEDGVLDHALRLFGLLAEAEARVHGIAPDDVEFHEVGAWDSVVDFVAAAWFIATLAPQRWSWSPLPLGSGTVRTAHGVLPVPAPATALLLQGIEVVDDGIAGERVTPTGAAIVRHLRELGGGATSVPSPAVLLATGHGFGTRKLPGVPNLVRVVAFAAQEAAAPQDEEIATLQFEVDDQTAEDLAVALERIRQVEGVLDASQLAVYGKKNRLATQVQVLVRPEAVDAAANACLSQTTTLGLRIARVWRRTLARTVARAAETNVKIAQRPSGEITAKAEMDDIARVDGGRDAREEARRRAEAHALENHPHSHDPRHPHDH